MTNWYVDSSIASSGNGQSWATAWKNISNISGLNAGDVVYISGGSSDSNQTYTINGSWTPIGGTAGNPVTYKIGQDSLHNGIAFFSGTGTWIGGQINNYIVSGDAGDGNMHFTIATPSNYVSPWTQIMNYGNSGKSNVRLSYINFGKILGPSRGAVLYIAGITGFELDHCYAYVTGLDVDAFGYIACRGTTWDSCKIHHNSIDVPRATGGIGADLLQDCEQGCSIYNNLFQTHSGYSGSQHGDGWQPGNGLYLKCYNNIFLDFTSYAIYLDPYASNQMQHVYVYNNLILIKDNSVVSDACKGIAVSAEGPFDYTDTIIANNIIVDYVNELSIYMNNAHSYIGCIVANNIEVNGGGFDINSNISTPNNISLTPSQASNYFTKYLTYGGINNDYHLKSTATPLIDKGTSLNSYFTTDKDGVIRPQGSAWDIGAYEYFSGTVCPTPIVGFTINIL